MCRPASTGFSAPGGASRATPPQHLPGGTVSDTRLIMHRPSGFPGPARAGVCLGRERSVLPTHPARPSGSRGCAPLQDIVSALEDRLRPLVQAELSVLVDVLHRPELLFPEHTDARRKCESGGFICKWVASFSVGVGWGGGQTAQRFPGGGAGPAFDSDEDKVKARSAFPRWQARVVWVGTPVHCPSGERGPLSGPEPDGGLPQRHQTVWALRPPARSPRDLQLLRSCLGARPKKRSWKSPLDSPQCCCRLP